MDLTDHEAKTRARMDALLRQGRNVYQPLYNYPFAQDIAPLRPCEDRCRAVEASMEGGLSGRSLWDLGCSLGYNTFHFVARGMKGHGIDIDPRNIAICRELRRWNRGEARFTQAELTQELIERVRPGEYDCAFLFSMLHHVIELRGLGYVQDMMRAMAKRVPVLYVELALRSEVPPPGYEWEKHLPEDELAIFSTCDPLEISLVGRFPTHVGPVLRPLYRVAARASL